MAYIRRFTRNTSVARPAENKYHNKKITVGGITFDSKTEYERWIFLRQREREGIISNLQRQVEFELIPKAVTMVKVQLKTKVKEVERVLFLPVTYKADFVYTKDGRQVVEDVKGLVLPEFKLKQKIFYNKYKTEIRIVKKATEEV